MQEALRSQAAVQRVTDTAMDTPRSAAQETLANSLHSQYLEKKPRQANAEDVFVFGRPSASATSAFTFQGPTPPDSPKDNPCAQNVSEKKTEAHPFRNSEIGYSLMKDNLLHMQYELAWTQYALGAKELELSEACTKIDILLSENKRVQEERSELEQEADDSRAKLKKAKKEIKDLKTSIREKDEEIGELTKRSADCICKSFKKKPAPVPSFPRHLLPEDRPASVPTPDRDHQPRALSGADAGARTSTTKKGKKVAKSTPASNIPFSAQPRPSGPERLAPPTTPPSSSPITLHQINPTATPTTTSTPAKLISQQATTILSQKDLIASLHTRIQCLRDHDAAVANYDDACMHIAFLTQQNYSLRTLLDTKDKEFVRYLRAPEAEIQRENKKLKWERERGKELVRDLVRRMVWLRNVARLSGKANEEDRELERRVRGVLGVKEKMVETRVVEIEREGEGNGGKGSSET